MKDKHHHDLQLLNPDLLRERVHLLLEMMNHIQELISSLLHLTELLVATPTHFFLQRIQCLLLEIIDTVNWALMKERSRSKSKSVQIVLFFKPLESAKNAKMRKNSNKRLEQNWPLSLLLCTCA